MEKETIQLTARIEIDIHRKMRFVAADKGISLNELINLLLSEAMEGLHISVPKELLSPR